MKLLEQEHPRFAPAGRVFYAVIGDSSTTSNNGHRTNRTNMVALQLAIPSREPKIAYYNVELVGEAMDPTP